MSDTQYKLAILQMQAKSTVLAALLTFFFGGIGMFYISGGKGIAFTVIEGCIWLFVLFTFGLGFPVMMIWHIALIFHSINCVNRYNLALIENMCRQ